MSFPRKVLATLLILTTVWVTGSLAAGFWGGGFWRNGFWGNGPIPLALADHHNPMLLDKAANPVQAHPFEGENLAGDPVRLADLKGKVVFINFWATWCVPCVLEMPSMESLNRKMKGKPFVMLAVNQAESPERIKQFLKKRGFRFSYELVLDQMGEIGAYYAVDRLPMTYLVDALGRVTHRAVGPREWDSADSVNLLEKLMADSGAKIGLALSKP